MLPGARNDHHATTLVVAWVFGNVRCRERRMPDPAPSIDSAERQMWRLAVTGPSGARQSSVLASAGGAVVAGSGHAPSNEEDHAACCSRSPVAANDGDHNGGSKPHVNEDHQNWRSTLTHYLIIEDRSARRPHLEGTRNALMDDVGQGVAVIRSVGGAAAASGGALHRTRGRVRAWLGPSDEVGAGSGGGCDDFDDVNDRVRAFIGRNH